ncbi:MAG: protein kinase [Acidobacteria bacterium]|nr:protein kinase [Acidobacteriota bacterium]
MATTPSHLPEGTQLGRYRVEAFVDEGGMGAVYRAHDTKLDRPVALKALRSKHRRDAAVLARFQREAQVLAQLNHPNICQVYDWVEAEGATYMAMEWVEGSTLSAILEATFGPLAPKRAMGIAQAIASALAAAHAKEIIHRDLKPGNVIIAADGTVKVLDFGLAKRLDENSGSLPVSATAEPIPAPPGLAETQANPGAPSPAGLRTQTALPPSPTPKEPSESRPSGALTAAGFVMGTPGYMSPEQVILWPVGPPSDVFALGIVLHEMLVGQRPFGGAGQELQAAVAANRRTVIRERPGPAKLWKLLERMLDPDPSARPRAAQVHAALEALQRPLGPKGWAGIAAGVTLVITSGLYWLSSRSIIADLVRNRPARLAILPMKNETGDRSLDAQVGFGLPELLASALRDSPKLAILDAGEARKVMARLAEPGAASDPGVPLLCKAMGAQLMLQGSLRREQGGEVLVLSLRDATGLERLRHEIRQPIQPEFVGQVYLDEASTAILKAVDPGGAPKRSAPQLSPEILSAYAQGRAFMERGEYKQAEPLLREAAHRSPQFGLLVGQYAICLMRLGSDKMPAVSEWTRFAGRASGDRSSELTSLQMQAFWAERSGDPPRAESLFLQALEMTRTMRDEDRESSALDSLGRLAQGRGQEAQARGYYDQAMAILERTGNQQMAISVHTNLANFALAHGDFQDAERQYRQILATAIEITDRKSEAVAENNLGVVYLSQQRLEEARRHLARAMEIRKILGDHFGEASTQRNLGILETMKGDLPAARLRIETSLAIARQANLGSQEASARYRLGELDRLEGRWEDSLGNYRLALEAHTRAEAKNHQADDLAGIAECLARKPRPDRKAAEAAMDKALSLAPGRPQVLKARAWIRHLQGKSDEALEDLEAALRDPDHLAPEFQGEMKALRDRFRPSRKSPAE